MLGERAGNLANKLRIGDGFWVHGENFIGALSWKQHDHEYQKRICIPNALTLLTYHRLFGHIVRKNVDRFVSLSWFKAKKLYPSVLTNARNAVELTAERFRTMRIILNKVRLG